MAEIDKKQKIYEISVDQVYKQLDVRPSGLTTEEAQRRLEIYGPNEIEEVGKTPLIYKFLAQFYHLFAILLWVAAVLSFLSDQAQLGYAVIGVIIINALFSFYQEFKAEKAVEALKKLLPQKARVLRDHEEKVIFAKDLVPGDIILLNEGDSISADARVIDQMELRTNNSTLTGESEPVRKSADPFIQEDLIFTHAPNLVFAGTSVAFGSGRGIVFHTAMNTEFGKIAALTQNVKDELSPLQKDLDKLVKLISVIAIVGGLVLLAFSLLFYKGPLTQDVVIGLGVLALGMIVANVPEGLLPTVTLGLSAGVNRLAKKGSIMKKLSSVETLGSTTVICTDKTGTLTQNEMTVRQLWANGEDVEVTGNGYEPKGDFIVGDEALSPGQIDSRFGLLFRAASFANDAKLLPPQGEERPKWSILGDPTEASLLVASVKGGIKLEDLYSEGFLVHGLPFESVRKRMSVIYRFSNGEQIAYTKGAPKETIELCTKIYINGEIKVLDDETHQKIIKQNDDYALKALRVLAVAYRPIPEGISDFDVENTEKDLIFIGLMAMYDPPRIEVEAAVNECYQAGIKIVMVTGDYGLTAEAIARKIGLVKGDQALVITGADLNNMTDDELKEKLKQPNLIFARVAPEHKMMVVRNYKEIGEIVAVTGDGVNDAPALKESNIGVAMGITGTDVSKEAADMIITDDNFATIVNAIEEGRTVFDNIRKFIVYIFAHLTPEIVPFIFFVLSSQKIPLAITVMLILAIDLGTDTLPALSLGIETPEPGIMQRPPRSNKEPIVNVGMLIKGYLFLGGLEGVLVMSAFFYALFSQGWKPGVIVPDGSSMYAIATTMTFLAIVATQIGNVLGLRTLRASVFKAGFFTNKLLIYGIIFELFFTLSIIYIPIFQGFFGTHALTLKDWLIVLPFPFIMIFAEEIRKIIVRKYYPIKEVP